VDDLRRAVGADDRGPVGPGEHLRSGHRLRGIAADERDLEGVLAEQEGVTDAYVCRLLPLTCLAPDIVEAILDGRQPKGLRLAEMLGNGPLAWEEQRGVWRFARSSASCA
jgi:hypothetical protein